MGISIYFRKEDGSIERGEISELKSGKKYIVVSWYKESGEIVSVEETYGMEDELDKKIEELTLDDIIKNANGDLLVRFKDKDGEYIEINPDYFAIEI